MLLLPKEMLPFMLQRLLFNHDRDNTYELSVDRLICMEL